MRNYLTQKAQKEMEMFFQARLEAIELLKLIVAEWESDPLSVQCFDARIVKRSKEVLALIDNLKWIK